MLSKLFRLRYMAWCLLALTLVACQPQAVETGGTEAESEAMTEGEVVTLEWWVNSEWGPEETHQLLKEQFEAEHPNIKVNLNYLPESGFEDLMNTAIGSGEGIPDVASWGENNWIPRAMDLTPFIEADPDISPDMYYEGFWNTRVASGDKITGLPHGAGANIVLYNKDVFDAAGVEYPTADWTPDEYLEIAKAVNNPEARIWGSDRPRGPFRAVWRAYGATPYSDNSTTVEGYFNSEGSLAAHQWLWDLVNADVSPTPADIDILGTEGTGPVDLFIAGRLAMATLNHRHMLTAAEAGIRYGALPEPHNAEFERYVNAWSLRSSIWQGTEHPDEAWELLKFWVGPIGQKIIMENHGHFPSLPELREEFVELKSTSEDSTAAIEVFFDSIQLRQVAEFDGTHLCWRASVRRVGETWDRIMLGEIERDEIKASLDADAVLAQEALDECVARLGS